METIKKSQKSDSELVQMYRNGSSFAFGVLINRHSRYLGWYIFNIVKDTMLAEDLLQDTFVKAMKAMKSGNYREEEIFKSWLTRIAHNLCIDYERKNKRMACSASISSSGIFETAKEKFYIPIPDLNQSPEEKLIKKETDFDIHQLIQNLPPEQKEVVMLRIFHNLSFSEIADFTNVSINTALGRMRYALVNLRKQIKEINSRGRNVLQRIGT